MKTKPTKVKRCKSCGSSLWLGRCLNPKCKKTTVHEEEDE